MPDLPPPDVLVWHSPPVQDVRDLVTPAERARAGRFRQDDDAWRFLTARALTRAAVGHLTGIAASEVHVAVHPTDGPTPGKPYVPDGPPVSIAHSGRWVVVAVGAHDAVGVDVEEVDRAARHIPVVAPSLPVAEQPAHGWDPTSFARAWTRREAVLKAVGTGLIDDTGALVLSPADTEPSVRRTRPPLPPAAHLRVVDAALPVARHPAAVAAVAVASSGPTGGDLRIEIREGLPLLRSLRTDAQPGAG